MWMGEGSCYIISGNIITRGAARAAIFKPIRMTVTDMQSIKDQVREIQDISRSTYTLEMMEYMGKATRDRVLGTDANMLKINKNKLRYGTMFTTQHVTDRINVVVLGEKIANKLFNNEVPIGKTIRINGNPFTVIGVIEHQEHFFGPEDPNARAFVPFTVAKKLFSKANESEDDLSAIALHFYPNVHSAKPLRKIKRIIRSRHALDEKEEDDFTIFDEESIKKTAEDAAGVIKLFGLIAASISLIVGGIGVMNIMLVSVQERTQEIGLRMAIGATGLLIRLQFLLEAIILCALGGIIGIAIGLAGLFLVGHLTNLPSIIEYTPLIISFLITIVIGIFFGYYPARIASLMNPIDALLER
jgi:ABC-type antimicrobial peptide transport system, permease component